MGKYFWLIMIVFVVMVLLTFFGNHEVKIRTDLGLYLILAVVGLMVISNFSFIVKKNDTGTSGVFALGSVIWSIAIAISNISKTEAFAFYIFVIIIASICASYFRISTISINAKEEREAKESGYKISSLFIYWFSFLALIV